MQEAITQAIQTVLDELGVTEAVFVVQHPDLSHGDYATNAALMCAKQLGRNPREVAETLKMKLEGSIPHVASITIAGPGFINFTLSRAFFLNRTNSIREQGDAWGRNRSWEGKKVLVEYTDPNPFKEFHVGHLFTNSVGESIARLFMMNGAEVKRINYGSDVGLHVAHALWGMRELGIVVDSGFTARDLGRAYAHGATAYKNQDPRAVREIRDINKKVYEQSDADINALYEKGRAVSIQYFKEIYDVIGSQFDAQFFESEVAERGKQLVLSHPELHTCVP
jgi:arginyl-tRNA synthetase